MLTFICLLDTYMFTLLTGTQRIKKVDPDRDVYFSKYPFLYVVQI